MARMYRVLSPFLCRKRRTNQQAAFFIFLQQNLPLFRLYI